MLITTLTYCHRINDKFKMNQVTDRPAFVQAREDSIAVLSDSWQRLVVLLLVIIAVKSNVICRCR